MLECHLRWHWRLQAVRQLLVMIFTARGTSENGFAQEVLALVNAERAKENRSTWPGDTSDAAEPAADERAGSAKVASRHPLTLIPC